MHTCLGAPFFCMTPAYVSNTTGRHGGKEETRARYETPHRTSWANNTVGGKTLSVLGGRERGPGACQLVWGMMFSSSGSPQANRSNGTHSRLSLSHRRWFVYFITRRLLWDLKKNLLQINFHYSPINEQVCNFAVNTLQRRNLPQSIVSALYWQCVWRKHALLITF